MENKKRINEPMREQAIDQIVRDIQKQFGRHALDRFRANPNEVFHLEVIPSGSILVDQILGIGGYPRAKITEIYGPEASGKTTLGLHAIVETQKQGGLAAFLDIEHGLDGLYARNLGVDLENLLVSRPETGEQAFDILEALLRAQVFDLIILDSVAALTPKAELEGEMGDQGLGLQARLMSKGLRKINSLISNGKTIVIFINQLREKIGIIFGNPEITPGGRALRFYAAIRLEVRRGEMIIRNGVTVGNRVKLKVVKNKVAPPLKSTIITINYHHGIDSMNEIFELALTQGLLVKSGVWYSQNDQRLGQGKQAVLDWWKSHPESYQKMAQDVRIANK